MVEIRPAALAELSLLPSIEEAADALLIAEAGAALALPAPATGKELAEALHIIVAGRPPVGFARIEQLDDGAHLAQLSVAPDFGHQGVGRALVSAALAWARESGYRSMTLTTFADLPFNAPFYASCGFTELAEPTPALAALLKQEKAQGLDALGRRIAMRAQLAPAVPGYGGGHRS